MSRKAVVQAVKEAGLPVAHMQFKAGSAPSLPWCVYYLDRQRGFDADNRRWANSNKWIVELYQDEPSSETEARLEESLSKAFGAFRKEEEWVETENCTMTTYQFTEIERSENG